MPCICKSHGWGICMSSFALEFRSYAYYGSSKFHHTPFHSNLIRWRNWFIIDAVSVVLLYSCELFTPVLHICLWTRLYYPSSCIFETIAYICITSEDLCITLDYLYIEPYSYGLAWNFVTATCGYAISGDQNGGTQNWVNVWEVTVYI